MAEREPSPSLPVLSDSDKVQIFSNALLKFVQLRPSHGPRENRAEPSRLSVTTRCAAWAMDTVKAAEYVWTGERAWRAQPKTGESTSSAATSPEESSDGGW